MRRPLLRPGGWLVVSEPPPLPPPGPRRPAPLTPRTPRSPEGSRWPAEPLRQLGLEPAGLVHMGFEYQTLRQFEACPERFPRRDGVPRQAAALLTRTRAASLGRTRRAPPTA